MKLSWYRFTAVWALSAASAFAGQPAAPQCAGCHRAEAQGFPGSAMAHALQPIAECDILKTHRNLSFQKDRYRYRITFAGSAATYEVTDGTQTLQVPLEWAFGLGDAGQTYVFRRNGNYYESHVSFYKAIQGLDVTMGAQSIPLTNLEDAAGRLMAPHEASQCFGCHATQATHDNKLDLAGLQPGVQCERCHAGSTQHAAALKHGDAGPAAVPKLSGRSAEEISNFCGQCHRSWSQIAADGPQGLANVRFQPYRLTNSKCYAVDDARIRCTACHNPHQALETTPARYDAKCQACHAGAGVKAGASQKRCPVATTGCVTCHMPKLELPGSHNRFTDHQIRVVRKNEAYPN